MTEVYSDLGSFIEAVNKQQEQQPTGKRKARDYWHPGLLRVYGLRPWEMGRLTLREIRMLVDDVHAIGRVS